MIRKILIFVITLFVVWLVSFLPIYPYISEVREIYETGETLSQEWRFVSMPEFYDSARFAKSAWMDSTLNYYLIFSAINYGSLIALFFVVRNIFIRLFSKYKQ